MDPMRCTEARTLLPDVLVGEPSPDVRVRFEAHLAGCPACEAEYRTLAATREAAAARSRPERPPAEWQRLADAIVARAVPRARPLERLPMRPRWPSTGGGAWGLRVAVAVLLVGFGVWLGRAAFPREVPVAAPGAAVEPTAEAVLEARTVRYLERARVLLLRVTHFDPATDDPAALDLERQQHIADELLGESAALREALAGRGAGRLERLMDDLDLVLLHLANLDADAVPAALERVQRGAQRKALLMQLDLEAIDRARTGSSTRNS